MRDQTATAKPSRQLRRHLDLLDQAVRAIGREARELLGQSRALEAQIDALSRSILQAARAVEEAKRHRDG